MDMIRSMVVGVGSKVQRQIISSSVLCGVKLFIQSDKCDGRSMNMVTSMVIHVQLGFSALQSQTLYGGKSHIHVDQCHVQTMNMIGSMVINVDA